MMNHKVNARLVKIMVVRGRERERTMLGLVMVPKLVEGGGVGRDVTFIVNIGRRHPTDASRSRVRSRRNLILATFAGNVVPYGQRPTGSTYTRGSKGYSSAPPVIDE